MAKILKINTNPNPTLRKKSTEIDLKKINLSSLKRLAADMIETMHESDGVGLAAPQIGKNLRLVVINTVDGELTLINPKITKKSFVKELGEEGCLSVPGVYGEVRRHKNVTCNYVDLNNKKIKIEAKGMLARVIQHELDHLDGVLFIDLAKKLKVDKKKSAKPEWTNQSKQFL